MFRKRCLPTLILPILCLATLPLAAADLNGTWLAEQAMPNGSKRETVIKLVQTGNTLRGKVENPMSALDIMEGTVEGETISFAVQMRMGGQARTLRYSGKLLDDNRMELQMERPNFGGGPGGPGAAPRPGGAAAPGGPGGPGGRAMGPMVARRLSASEVRAREEAEARRPKPVLPEVKALPANGLAPTPPMGWNSWNAFRTQITDAKIRATADAMVASGMRDAGYQYLVIDDGWQGERDANGVLQPNANFPDMKALGDYVHSKGLKFGIYSSPGPLTCGGFAGSYGYEEIDARTWASWGVDYLKYDWCAAARVMTDEQMPAAYQLMAEKLRATGRPIVYALCQYGRYRVQDWGAKAGGNLWRTTGDIRDNWASMERIGFEQQEGLAPAAGPGHWNDPDMLEVGNGGMTDTEYRTHMTLWVMLAAPLLAGNDLTAMSEATKATLLNREVLAIHQDKLGRQGTRASQDGKTEVWMRPLAGGRKAVALFNRGDGPATVHASWADLQVRANAKVRNVWEGKDLGPQSEGVSATVPSHGTVLLVVEN